jgi:agmatine/peptidylarginine deiminase
MLAEVDQCYHSLVEALLQAGQTVLIATPEPERVNGLIADLKNLGAVKVAFCLTNDTWTRDDGQLTAERSDGSLLAVAYQFNGWGLKFAADKDNKAVLSLMATGDLSMPIANRKSYVLEGGSIESDGCGTILTTSECMLSINRNGFIEKPAVERELAESLGAKRVLWLDYGALAGDDTDSHVDTLARLAPHDTILYVKSYNPADDHTADLEKMEAQLKEFRTEAGLPYNLIGLPLPDAIFDVENGERLPATYANFLITPHAVLMPTYNQPHNDDMAKQMLQIAFPDHEILTVDCRALIRQHGSLHCATMQFPKEWIVE